MHGKYKNNKVWGGAVGSVSFKGSPKKFELKQNLKLPPLNNKPIFNTEKMTMNSTSTSKFTAVTELFNAAQSMEASNFGVARMSQRAFNQTSKPNQRRSDSKPQTASQSVKMLDKVDSSAVSAKGSKKQMRKTGGHTRNPSQTINITEKPSEFNM